MKLLVIALIGTIIAKCTLNKSLKWNCIMLLTAIKTAHWESCAHFNPFQFLLTFDSLCPCLTNNMPECDIFLWEAVLAEVIPWRDRRGWRRWSPPERWGPGSRRCSTGRERQPGAPQPAALPLKQLHTTAGRRWSRCWPAIEGRQQVAAITMQQIHEYVQRPIPTLTC